MTLAFDRYERARWAGRAAAYDRSFAQLCAHPAGALLDAAGVTAGTRLLDAGTGPGTVAGQALTRGASVVAVDPEAGMLRLAAGRLTAGPDVALCQALLPLLPFADGSFDAVAANFVVNHVGDPAAAVAELGRVTRPGGRVAVTIWPVPAPPAQSLWGEIFDAAGAVRPAAMPRLTPERDFARTETGLAGLLAGAGLTGVRVTTLRWHLRIDPEDWWSGPAAGVASPGFVLEHQPPAMIPAVRAAFDRLTKPYLGSDGLLRLPTEALLAVGIMNGC